MYWDLNDLYESFTCEKFKNDYENLEKEISKINNFATENFSNSDDSVRKIEQYITLINDFTKYINLAFYTRLILSVDCLNETAMKIMDNLEVQFAELERPAVMFKRFLSQVEDLESKIESSELLKEHKFFITNNKKESTYMLSEQEEIVIARLQNTGSRSFTKLQQQLTSTLLVEMTVDGEEKMLPLPLVRSFASSKDAEKRKAAYFAELESYKKIDKSVAFALNSIKGEVITLCKMRKYDNALDMTLQDSHMDRETLDALLGAMKDYLPSFRKYLKAKAKFLGHENGLPFYDLLAPVGTLNQTFTYEEAQEYIVKNFASFSTELAELTSKAFRDNWLDVKIREGKSGGAFCSNLHNIKQSRIMSNFNDDLDSVMTLAHELGHAYHGYCLREETSINSKYSMPIAETASTFCETILSKAILNDPNVDSNTKKVILENELQGATQIIVDIYSRFLFEDAVFKKRETGSLSVEELNSMMLEAQLEAYGDGLDPNVMHPYMWLCKGHYYSATRNYYNFPYAFGQLFAKGLYSIYLEKGDSFVELYKNMLQATGKNNLKDIASLAQIDITKKEFWASSLKLVEEEIEELLKLL